MRLALLGAMSAVNEFPATKEFLVRDRIDRRTFILACLSALMNDAATAYADNQARPLETFTQWLNASVKTRRLALQSCLDRIHAVDPSIHAWVQVSPQRPTGQGKLSEIPFGVKDIIETRGLATEYGSPIYKGRIGTADAAIVREMRQRGGILLGKTHCTAFAYFTPPPTRNPRDLNPRARTRTREEGPRRS